MVAKIGPAHGDHTTPKDSPVIKPCKNPEPVFVPLCPNKFDKRETKSSNLVASAGIIMVNPRNAIITTAIKRRILGSR
jgi:hypothetical protein